MLTQSLSRADYSGSLVLCVLALVNYLLFYVINITLARNLSVRDFDDFSVALSAITILSTVATLGLDKYALRCIPVYRERGDWTRSLGFWTFSLRTIVLFSLLLAFIGLMLGIASGANSPIALVILVLFLPAIAPALFLVEVVTANGRQIEAVMIYRLLLPTSFLFFVYLIFLFDLPMTAVGVACGYGLAWLWTLSAIHQLARLTMPEDTWRARPDFLRAKWVRRAVPLLLNSWMLSVMAGSGVIVLELLYPSDAIVGTYAVAAQTGTFIVLLANTANRFYLPLTSMFMERADGLSLRRLMRHRLMVVGGLAIAFLTVVVVRACGGRLGQCHFLGFALLPTVYEAEPQRIRFHQLCGSHQSGTRFLSVRAIRRGWRGLRLFLVDVLSVCPLALSDASTLECRWRTDRFLKRASLSGLEYAA
jgi:O-antigen/teichoic acid export membrane protein